MTSNSKHSETSESGIDLSNPLQQIETAAPVEEDSGLLRIEDLMATSAITKSGLGDSEPASSKSAAPSVEDDEPHRHKNDSDRDSSAKPVAAKLSFGSEYQQRQNQKKIALKISAGVGAVIAIVFSITLVIDLLTSRSALPVENVYSVKIEPIKGAYVPIALEKTISDSSIGTIDKSEKTIKRLSDKLKPSVKKKLARKARRKNRGSRVRNTSVHEKSKVGAAPKPKKPAAPPKDELDDLLSNTGF
jgi:hypothetical protein